MADGGGWVSGASYGLNGSGDDGVRLARERFLDVLTEFGERLNSPLPHPRSRTFLAPSSRHSASTGSAT